MELKTAEMRTLRARYPSSQSVTAAAINIAVVAFGPHQLST